MNEFSYVQSEWLKTFEYESGFDVLWQDEYINGEITFYQLVSRNIAWLEDYQSTVLKNVSFEHYTDEELTSV